METWVLTWTHGNLTWQPIHCLCHMLKYQSLQWLCSLTPPTAMPDQWLFVIKVASPCGTPKQRQFYTFSRRVCSGYNQGINKRGISSIKGLLNLQMKVLVGFVAWTLSESLHCAMCNRQCVLRVMYSTKGVVERLTQHEGCGWEPDIA